MKLFDRLILLAKADAHGVLEQLEERSLLAKQCLREAELELDRKRAQVDSLEDEARRLGAEAERLEQQSAALDADVELALEGDKQELARFSVRKLLPLQHAVAEARARIETLGAERARLLETLATQQAQLEEMRSRVRGLVASERAERVDPLAAPPTVADEEVELELLRRRTAAEVS